MKKYGFIISLLLAGVLLFNSTALAKKSDLPKYIKDQLHSDITYTVITERDLDRLDELVLTDKKHHFVVVQIPPEQFKKQHADMLMGWVKKGGVLWFYDSRLAPFFGMENSPLKEDDVRGKPYDGDYGTQKVKGINTIAHAYPFSEHPVKTGVQSIQVFLMKVGENTFSAVSEKTEGVIPLFRVNVEPKAVVALKKIGQGWVVFKPLLWPDVLGGERFQTNLKEFSGGYPVPKSEKPVIPAEAFKGKQVKLSRYDSLILSDGQQVIGKVEEDKFEFMGPEGTVTKKVEEIDYVKFRPTGDEIKFKDGGKFNGSTLALELKLKTTTGKTVTIGKEHIMSIKFDISAK